LIFKKMLNVFNCVRVVTAIRFNWTFVSRRTTRICQRTIIILCWRLVHQLGNPNFLRLKKWAASQIYVHNDNYNEGERWWHTLDRKVQYNYKGRGSLWSNRYGAMTAEITCLGYTFWLTCQTTEVWLAVSIGEENR